MRTFSQDPWVIFLVCKYYNSQYFQMQWMISEFLKEECSEANYGLCCCPPEV